MKKIKNFSEHICKNVTNKSFRELAEEIEEYSYILGDEGYDIELRQFHGNRMNLFIRPKLESEIDRLKRRSTISQALYNIDKSLYFEKFPWMRDHKDTGHRLCYDISWKDLFYHQLKEQDFYEEWLDRITDICVSNSYSIEFHLILEDYINDGIVFYIKKKQ